MDNVSWLKDCEICNVGLCKRIDGLKDEGSTIREAARIMEAEADGLWDAEKIRARYYYYKGGRKPTGKKDEDCMASVEDLDFLINKMPKIKLPRPQVPDNWDYEHSCERVKSQIAEMRRLAKKMSAIEFIEFLR